jgi:hypothetical protein
MYLFEGLLDKQGVLYVRGNTLSGANTITEVIIKLSNTGTMITTGFGTNGVVTIPNTKDVTITNFALQSTGKFIVGANESKNDEVTSSFLTRFNANGTLDNTFGTQGKLTVSTNTATKYKEMYTIKTIANDKIITNFIGEDESADAWSFTEVNRLSANGVKDNDFGKSGTVLIESDSLLISASAIVIQENTNSIFVYSQAENEDEIYYNLLAKILNPFGVAVKENMEVNNFNVFPTVVETQATITYELTQEETVSIQLIDIQGKVVANYLNRQAQMAGKYQQVIEIPSAISSGTYFVTLTNSKGSTSVKIIK